MLRGRIDSSCKSKLRVICYLKSMIEILRFDHCQDRSKNLFLFDRVTRLYFIDYGGLNEVTVRIVPDTACNDLSAFVDPFIDIRDRVVESTFVDHRCYIRRAVRWLADLK